MFADARSVPRDTRLETDVCIIGAGAAGITLAREFSGSPFRVTLLESGGFQYETETQALYEGPSVGLPYSDLSVPRLRFFGRVALSPRSRDLSDPPARESRKPPLIRFSNASFSTAVLP